MTNKYYIPNPTEKLMAYIIYLSQSGSLRYFKAITTLLNLEPEKIRLAMNDTTQNALRAYVRSKLISDFRTIFSYFVTHYGAKKFTPPVTLESKAEEATPVCSTPRHS